MHPKVFVSHASEDKDRFVTSFATKLRENGVDAWLDRWEMLPGDSLVDKIYEEGLKEAQAIIIVLSNYSVEKPWVREELNASIVSRISKGTKIIPIVLDDCEVPESLKSTLWQPIKDLRNYEESFNRILSSIFGVTDKPDLGSPPVHTSIPYIRIGELTKPDNIILKESCKWAIANNMVVDPDTLFGDGKRLGFNRNEIKDCIEILHNNRYFDISWLLGGNKNSYSCHYRITVHGFDRYLNAYDSNYSENFSRIVSLIVNEGIHSNYGIKKKLNLPLVVIDNYLQLLESNGQLQLSKTIGEQIKIYHVAVSLRRSLQ